VAGRAALITGGAGTGKSSLALEMIALGARLVSDDQVVLRRRGDRILASPPDAIAGLIEARGVGLLRVEPLRRAVPVTLCVDLNKTEPERLPPQHRRALLGVELPLVHRSAMCHFAAALIVYLKGGRAA
jgi:HPr kinase/phosphorylase